MGGKEGVVEGTQQRGELPNSPGVGGTVQGLWFRERRLAARGSAPSREHPCTCCFLRRGLTQPYEGHSPSFHRWGNRGSGTLSLLPKVTEQTGSHPLLSCDPGTDPKLTLRAGCGQQSWGDASPSYTESPHSPLETPQEGVGRGSAGQVTSAGPRMKESRLCLRLRNANRSHRPVSPLGLIPGTPKTVRSPGQKDPVCPLRLPGLCRFCCHHRPDRAGLSLPPSPARSGIFTAWTGGLGGNTGPLDRSHGVSWSQGGTFP